ncbi:NAD(P)/FAD-dependent oxidoreductase [Halobacillus salinarum]|uniref:Ferredoxin--NADP reductase n=1 Tax=Halobacillus salinarum TaxID=2932257 RepID=A0ABY4EIC8_9BACI|nr:NAD(P)/FAD-dependent oxidoreductase [Halobacillus salinarum]UOQ44244.1 NAD(P)/FAD-dependent oxidoreductase [Halobacillus salinarum]
MHDVIIIGGGPAGLFSAFYSGLRKMKTKIIESHPFLGGKVHVYPEKMVWDVGGVPPLSGQQLIDQLIEQGMTFEPDLALGEKVNSIEKEDGVFKVCTDSNQEHYSKTVIVAVGGGIIEPKKLQIHGAEKFEVSNLHYTVPSFQRFVGKRVLISGGSHSAIDWANELAPLAERVELVYRKEELKGHEASIELLIEQGVHLHEQSSIQALTAAPSGDRIEQVVLEHPYDGIKQVKVDEVIISHGFNRDASLLNESPIDLDRVDDFFIKGTPLSASSVPGLYAAGDILHHEGKLHLIAGAFQDAANAVNLAKQFIDPDANARAMVSSHNERLDDHNKRLKKQRIANL